MNRGNVIMLFASPKQIADRKRDLLDWSSAAVGEYTSKATASAKDLKETVADFRRIEPDGSAMYVELAAKVAKVVELHLERVDLVNRLLDGIAATVTHERAEIERLEARSSRFFG